MNTVTHNLTHKGYTASVHYDEGDNIFVGRILGIRSIISFHAETATQLQPAFELAVDDYLADCEETAITAEKPILND